MPPQPWLSSTHLRASLPRNYTEISQSHLALFWPLYGVDPWTLE